MNGPAGIEHSPYIMTPAEILQNLIRFNTTNPPGNEAPCISYIKSLLNLASIPTTVLSLDASRPNLVACLPGRGDAPPLLMYGHVDVVTTANQQWQIDPFSGMEKNNCIWGRGALDMKGAVAMMLAALLRASLEGFKPAGDIIFAALSDEENRGEAGARFLVDKHPDKFKGVKYAIGEFGGYSTYIHGKRFYPVMVTEKQVCNVLVTFSGPGGHGAWPARGGIMYRVATFLHSIEQRLPVHVTPVARAQVRGVAEKLASPLKQTYLQLLVPSLTNAVLDRLGADAELFDPVLHNTANVTAIHGGESFNMIPGKVSIALDCRLLPGSTPDDILTELKDLAGSDLDYAISFFSPGPSEPDMGLFETLANILRDADPDGTVIPMMFPAVTDARLFAKLGIQTYGFTPMDLPHDIEYGKLLHAADERIPVRSLEFGTSAISELIHRYGGK